MLNIQLNETKKNAFNFEETTDKDKRELKAALLDLKEKSDNQLKELKSEFFGFKQKIDKEIRELKEELENTFKQIRELQAATSLIKDDADKKFNQLKGESLGVIGMIYNGKIELEKKSFGIQERIEKDLSELKADLEDVKIEINYTHIKKGKRFFFFI